MAPQNAFSNTLLKVAVHYIYGRVMEMPVEELEIEVRARLSDGAVPDELAAELDQAIEELGLVFSNLGVNDSDRVAEKICHTSLGVSERVKENSAAKLSVSKYDCERKQILAELALKSSKGALLWPPTSQTLISRMGGKWTAAMEACGLAASSDGKIGRRNARFTQEDRQNALRKFLRDCEEKGATPSYAGYAKWAKEQGGVPSAATIRQSYGTWQKALDQV